MNYRTGIFTTSLVFTLMMYAATGYSITLTASSSQGSSNAPSLAVDGNMQTRWSSEFSDSQWLTIDLEARREITGLTMFWEAAYAKAYDILLSDDNQNWEKVYSTADGEGFADDVYFGKHTCRFIKILFNKRATQWGYSLWEVKIKGPEASIKILTPQKTGSPNKLFDGDRRTLLDFTENSGTAPWIEFHPQVDISFGALKIIWGANFASSYSLEVSRDKINWKTIYETKKGAGGTEVVPANALGVKYVRLNLKKGGAGKGYSIAEIKFRSWKEIAKKSSLDMKRSVVGAEGYDWVTFVGKDGKFAPEPWPYEISYWVFDEGEKALYTPETLKTDWMLKDGRFPISVSSWKQDGLSARSTIFANKIKNLNRLVTFDRIAVKNTGSTDKKLSLYLLVRKNPLAAAWKTSLNDVTYDGRNTIRVNGKIAVCLKEKPASGMNVDLSANRLVRMRPLDAGQSLRVDGVDTEAGFIGYKIELKPGEERNIDLYAASGESQEFPEYSPANLDFASALAETENYWKERTDFRLDVPDKEYSDCFYSSVYYMLILMKGNGLLYPGPYAYKSFFLHDSIEMGAALDKVGIHDVAQKATEHYNTKDYGGYGDELGGSIFGYYEHYRITKDTEFLRKSFASMLAGCELIRQKRAPQMAPQFAGTAIYGLVAKSVSQDNFTIPAFLYVDDWWAIMGLKATADAAKILDISDAKWVEAEYRSLLKCTLDSIKKVMSQEDIDYATGFADYWPQSFRKMDAEHRILGDAQMAWAHRPAFFPGQSLGVSVPPGLFEKSYKHYWDKAGKFSNYDGGWYVEYEKQFWGYNVQLAHPMMLLGMGDVTLKNIKWSLNHQSCPGGWCEALNLPMNQDGSREGTDGIIGDVPHGWTAAYYVHLLRNMIYHELPDKMVLLGCIPENWLGKGKHITVSDAPTYFGNLDFHVESASTKNEIRISIDMRTPPASGYKLYLPLQVAIKGVEIDGVDFHKYGEKSVDLPASAKTVVVKY